MSMRRRSLASELTDWAVWSYPADPQERIVLAIQMT